MRTTATHTQASQPSVKAGQRAPRVRYAALRQVKKASGWSIKKYASAFRKLAE
jgi:hypothetical protein